ncbi:restriction endonuclease [Anaerolineales bacterium HSG25]|nr:restriction endonuclease [Anaerolineales bacterium HSG25]
MNLLDAAYEILKQAKEPLHYTEITKRALDANLLETKGQTPPATMGSRLYTDTKRPQTRFRRVSRGVFGLSQNQPTGITQRIQELNQQTRSALHQRLSDMSPDQFEVLVSQLLNDLGFEEDTIEVTSYSRDGGIDVRGVLNAAGITKINAAVQAKRWKRNIRAPEVQALRGALTVHEQGIFITTSKFSKGAITEAQASGKAPISLIDGPKLVSLLLTHEIGVNTEQHTIYTLDTEWWGDVVGDDEPETTTEPDITVTVTFPLPVEMRMKKHKHQALMLDRNGRMLFNEAEYGSPSGACKTATGWKACDGWHAWKFYHAETDTWYEIDRLRINKVIL